MHKHGSISIFIQTHVAVNFRFRYALICKKPAYYKQTNVLRIRYILRFHGNIHLLMAFFMAASVNAQRSLQRK